MRKRTSLAEIFRTEAERYGARSPEARERRARAWDDFAFFCRTYLPHYFTLPLAPFQLHIIEGLLKEPRLAIAAPRESGKSVLTGIAFPLWSMLTGRVRFQIDIGASLDHSRSNVLAIREELESNELIIRDFGPQKPELTEGSKPWTQTMLVTRGRAAIMARGAGSSIRGLRFREFRPDLVRLDDVEDDESVRSEEQREKLFRWFKRVVLFLGRHSRIFVIGTILHSDSLLARLVRGELGFKSFKFKALTDEGESLWPEMMPVERLLELRRQDPISFSFEMQNEPVDEETALFRREWLRFYSDLPTHEEWALVVEFVDPALGGSRGDFSAIVRVARHRRTGRLYVISPFIERITPERLIEKLFERYLYLSPRPTVIGFESVGFQKVIKQWLDEKSRQRGVYLPVRDVDQRGISKEARISRLSPLFENGTILLPERGAERLIEQLLPFPRGDHDDGPDALEGAVSLIGMFREATAGFRAARSFWTAVTRF